MNLDKIKLNISRFNAKIDFTSKKRIAFYNVLKGFLEDNSTSFDAIHMLEARSARAKSASMYAYHDMATRMRNGATLTEALGKWAPQKEVVFIAVGEQSGDLEKAIDELIEMMETASQLTAIILGALKNPLTYMGLFIGVVLMISIAVAPKISGAIDIEKGGIISVAFFATTNHVGSYWWVYIVLLAVFSAVVAATIPVVIGPPRVILNKIPPWSLYQRLASAYFLISLSAMLKSGITLIEAINEIGKHGNPWMRYHTRKMVRNIKKGLDQGQVLHTGMMPDDVAEEIIDYGQLSSFNSAINRIGKNNIISTTQKFKRFGAVLDAASRVAMFGFIIFMMYGTFNVILAVLGETAH